MGFGQTLKDGRNRERSGDVCKWPERWEQTQGGLPEGSELLGLPAQEAPI